MAYQSDTIATVINRLNIRYFLPAIQREFVWHPDQIIKLFDSIMRGYPISSFLFWELKAENRDKWEVYKFIDHFKQGGTHNELAVTDGVQQLNLVLDGQQRLTSLLIGLKGTYTVKKRYRRWDSPDAWVKQSLFLDLLKDPKIEEDDGEAGVRYGFLFMDKAPRNDRNHCWIKIGHILDFDNEDRFYEFRQNEKDKLPDDVTKGQISVFERNLDRLYRAIWKDEVISYYTEHDQDYDRVLDIFVRANEGGTKLSKSDLLLSMVTSKWGGVNAREEIYGFVDRINNDLIRKNDFDKDFIMKTCLVLCDLPVQYKVENFNNQNLALIHAKWKDIKAAIEMGVNLVNSFGIDRDTLTSANALIPIIYYFYKHPAINLRGTTRFDVKNAHWTRRWLTMALLNNVFGGQSDNLLRDLRRILQEHQAFEDFPVEAINNEIAKSGRTSYFDDNAIENFLSITYGRQVTFLALSLLYDDSNWGRVTFHQDHIFPQSMFSKKQMTEAGLDADAQERYEELMNRVGNLQLLLSTENQEKSDKDFDKWLPTRDPSFRQRHLIPHDNNLLKFGKFEEFVEARENLIRERLKIYLLIANQRRGTNHAPPEKQQLHPGHQPQAQRQARQHSHRGAARVCGGG
jgi:uncharacterized protein with ParB-like and HNH nuclease domain